MKMSKLKILPPTLREKKRYVAFELFSENKINKDDFIVFMWNNLINLYGEITCGNINLWFISFKYIEHKNNRFKYKCIVKCQRGYEKNIHTMLASIIRYKNMRLVAHTLATSGTIHSLDKKYDLL